MFLEVNKSQIAFETTKKQNESLKSELEKFKKENAGLKNLNVQNKNNITEMGKDDREKVNLLKTSLTRIESLESTVNEKDQLINESNNKIQELLQTLDRKEAEIKNLIKMSQNCDQENKSNIDEITKQANTTIRLFYSSVSGEKNLQPDINQVKVDKIDKDHFGISAERNEKGEKIKKPLFSINHDVIKDKKWVELFDEIFNNIISGVPGLSREAQEK